mgnify:CR=1 FL=1
MRATNWPVCSVWCSPTGPIRTHSPWPKSLKWGAYLFVNAQCYQRLWQKSVGADAAAVRQAMEQTATLPFSHRPLSTLSDGERQRVFIAKALAQGTPVILLDEPTAFLDFPSK